MKRNTDEEQLRCNTVFVMCDECYAKGREPISLLWQGRRRVVPGADTLLAWGCAKHARVRAMRVGRTYRRHLCQAQ